MLPANLPLNASALGAVAPAPDRFWFVGTPNSPHAEDSDDALLREVGGRGPDAERSLSVLYARYAASIYGLALRMTRSPSDAEEVAQDTFWSLWRHAGTYQPGRVRFATGLLRIAHNQAVSVLRHRRCRPAAAPHRADDDPAPEGADPADPAADVPELAYLAGLRHAIKAAVLALPPEQRNAVELAYFGGMSHTEIAAAQRAPLGTVKTRLALGLKKLAAILVAQRAES